MKQTPGERQNILQPPSFPSTQWSSQRGGKRCCLWTSEKFLHPRLSGLFDGQWRYQRPQSFHKEILFISNPLKIVSLLHVRLETKFIILENIQPSIFSTGVGLAIVGEIAALPYCHITHNRVGWSPQCTACDKAVHSCKGQQITPSLLCAYTELPWTTPVHTCSLSSEFNFNFN